MYHFQGQGKGQGVGHVTIYQMEKKVRKVYICQYIFGPFSANIPASILSFCCSEVIATSNDV